MTYHKIGYSISEPNQIGANMSILQAHIENGTRYDLVEIYAGDTLIATTGELRVAASILSDRSLSLSSFMVVPEFDEEGEPTNRTLILIEAK